jgi:hypothetical protein
MMEAEMISKTYVFSFEEDDSAGRQNLWSSFGCTYIW